MSFKINSSKINLLRRICDETDVHSISADYILPDYYPDVSRVMKTTALPVITSYSIKDNILHYDLQTTLTVLYKSSESELMQSVTQVKMFSKDLTLNENCSDAVCEFSINTESVWCRAKNERRLETEAAVSVQAVVKSSSEMNILCDAFGNGIQVKKQPVTYMEKINNITKNISVSEETPLSDPDTETASVLFCQAAAEITEIRNVSEKLAVKGEINACVVYTFSGSSNDNISSFRTSLPFSQIIDTAGFSKECHYQCRAEVLSCSCKPANDPKGITKSFQWNCDLRLICSMASFSQCSCITDAYSTKYDINSASSHIYSVSFPQELSFDSKQKTVLQSAELTKIYSLSSEIKNIRKEIIQTDGKIKFSGMLTFSLIGKNAENSIICPETEAPFEISVPCSDINEYDDVSFRAYVKRSSYDLLPDGKTDLQSEICIKCCIMKNMLCSALTELKADEQKPLEIDNTIALKLYFGKKGESIWDIAKKYKTSADAVSEANNTGGETLPEDMMILIPLLS